MRGMRPLTDQEINQALNQFHRRDPNFHRDRALFIVGVYTGFRASELLSLRVKDIEQYGCIMDTIEVQRRHMKGKRQSRQIVLHKYAREALRRLLGHYKEAGVKLCPDTPVFLSREGTQHAIGYVRFYQILKECFEKAKLSGKLACHSLRKTFARLFLVKSNDNILGLQRMLGHSSPTVTMAYCTFRDSVYQDIVLSF